jgi:hypothetical protein
LQAIALQGPEGTAASEYKRTAGEHTSWESSLGSLRQYLDHAAKAGAPLGPVYREMAEVMETQLGRLDRALAALGE